VRQSLHVDPVVGERLGVLAEAKAVEPLSDVFGHPVASPYRGSGRSLRLPGDPVH
jgi:hypothetical protein